jgi:type VI secretion system protein ImpA
MLLREDILAPIAGENPSGIDLRYDTRLLIYDKIREARRQDDGLAQGDWQSERKTANYPLVVKLSQDTLATTSKDLQLAAWLTEALLAMEHYAGLGQGLTLCSDLLTNFWETVYPVIEDGDRELRAKPLSWMGSMLDVTLRSAPLVSEGHSWFAYQDSRKVGFEDQAKTDKDRKTRAKLIEDGKIPPEIFDKAFADTPKAFYLKAEKDLDQCLATLESLETFCDEHFEDDAPPFGKLKTALTEVRHTVHSLLTKKREKEPDPVEEVPVVEPVQAEAVTQEDGTAPVSAAPLAAVAAVLMAEPGDLRQAVSSIAAGAAFLRKQEPLSPAPYLILRGLRWGELRTVTRLSDSTLLEAPPTELRQKVKRLALANRWGDLLDACEDAMALPCSRAWLDLQRFSVAACSALGTEYQPIATAIQSELRALLNDLPELLEATLLDDTPAANPETKAWLRRLQDPPSSVTADSETDSPTPASSNGTPSWLTQSADAYVMAKDALAAGHEDKAFAIMRSEINRQRSGRGRFRRTMQLIELVVSSGKDAIAQPLLDDVTAMIENHKLDAWEEPEQVARDLLTLMLNSKKIQGSSSDKQKMFERICRLDPVQALSVG